MKVVLTFLFLLLSFAVSGQDLIEVTATKSDVMKGVKLKYEYDAKDRYLHMQLLLFKNGRYQYEFSTFNRNLFSNGKWIISEKVLMLNSDISKDDVPAYIVYSNDTVNGFRIDVVRNQKGTLLTDAFVNVNADSIRCLPMAASCIGSYQSIDSVRLLFENGFKSKWMKVSDNSSRHIIITVKTDFRISSYTAFDNFKCRIIGRIIKPIEHNWVE